MNNLKEFILAKEFVRLLNQNGFEAWFVGGAIRDLLLDITPKDFDIVTNASLLEIRGLFPFEPHGKVTEKFLVHAFKCEDKIFEIASFRDEGTIENRFDAPKQGTRDTDWKRRDFTCNAIFWNPITFDIFDPCNGVNDIKNNVLRTTRDPEIVFTEDPVRVLRAIRFQRKFGFRFDFDINKFLNLVDFNDSRFNNELIKIRKIRR